MNKDEIFSMALEFGWKSYSGPLNAVYSFDEKDLERFAALVAEKEREACANTCDSTYYQHIGPQFGEVRQGIATCAAAIRARGETK